MITFGRLSDLVNNRKALDFNKALFFVFEHEHIQLFTMELNTGDPQITTHGQLFLEGIDSKGVALEKIGGTYSPFTIEAKKADRLPFDRVTLYQEGDFYGSWEFTQKNDSFILSADTMKKDLETGEVSDLQARWGADLIGLTDESISKLAEEIAPLVVEYILRTLLR